jgi:predicted dehydrogenase
VGKVINCYVQNPHKLLLEDRKSWELDEDVNGGAIVDLGCHSVDLVRWFSGSEIIEVTAYHSNLKFPQIANFKDNGAILLRMKDGSTALLRTDWLSALGAADFMDYFLIISGDNGALEVRDGADKHVRYATDTRGFSLVDPVEPSHGMIQDFLNNVRGNGPTVLTTRDAMEATRVTLHARRSADEGRTLQIP